MLAAGRALGMEKEKKILSIQELAFRELGRRADLPLHFRVIRAMVEGCRVPGLGEEWHPTQLLGRRGLEGRKTLGLSPESHSFAQCRCVGTPSLQRKPHLKVGEQEKANRLGSQVHSSGACRGERLEG